MEPEGPAEVLPAEPGTGTGGPAAALGGEAAPDAEAQARYAAEVLQPLLAVLAHEAMKGMPSRLAAFFLAWLLEHLQAPAHVLEVVQPWLRSVSDGQSEDMMQGRAPGSSSGRGRPALSVDASSARGEGSPRRSPRGSPRSSVRFVAEPVSPDVKVRGRLPSVSLSERAGFIRNVPLFEELSSQDVDALAAVADICHFGPDCQIVQHGSHHEALHLILSGEGRVSVPSVVGTLTSGDSFGEHALVRRHLAAAQTISVPGSEGGELVTLAITYDMLASLGLMSRLSAERRWALVSSTPAAGEPEQGRLSSDDEAPSGLEPSVDPAGLVEAKRPSLKSGAPMRPEDRVLIEQAIRSNVHFSDWLCLSQYQVEMMIDMMTPATASTGEEVVRKGEFGNRFFIVSDGLLEVTMGGVQTENAVRARLRSGDSFGELNLLYNCPRKATVRAQRPCHLWVLERSQFRAVMRLKSETRVQEYVRLIDSVELLSLQLTTSEKMVLAEALEEVFCVKGEEVVTQSHAASTFFVVCEGCCEVRVNGEMCNLLQKGDFFGEQALLSNQPHAATVTVISGTAVLLALDSASFHVLLGDAMASMSSKASPKRETRRMNTTDLVGKLFKRMPGTEKPKVPWESLEEIGVLGVGSFGHVTLQQDRHTGSLYALKSLSKGYIKSRRLEKHVLNERKAMQTLESDFLVHLHCTYRCPQYVYFLMEPALGGELYEVYTKNEHMFGSSEHAKFYVVCATLGLQHLHERRIIYRDLKLENALLNSNGYACLTDLGLAKVVIGKTYTVCGTADYLAPEILRQTGHNRAVDWWALGIMLFIMMAGRSPFDAEDVMQIYRNIVKGFKRDSFPIDFSEEVVDLIQRLCRKKPERRLPMGPGGAGNIQGHAWFESYQWDKVVNKSLAAPFQPPEHSLQDYRTGAKNKRLLKKQATGDFIENDPETDNGWDADF